MSKAVKNFEEFSIDTMLPESSDVSRSWLKKLTSLPDARRSESQLIILNSFSQLDTVMKLPVVTKYLSTQTSTTSDVDLKDPTLIEALYRSVQVLATSGGIGCIPQYMPKKDANGLQRFLRAASIALICRQRRTESITNLNPENIVSLILASILVLQNLSFGGLYSDDELRKDIMRNHVMRVSTNLKSLRQTQPSLVRKCDKYLNETLGSKLTMEAFYIHLESSALSSLCTYIGDQLPNITLEGLKIAVEQVKVLVGALLEASDSVARVLGNYFSLFHQSRTLSLCFNYMILDGQNGSLLAEWWVTADLYLRLLKRAMKSAQAEADFYVIGTISRRLLHAMLQGVSKNVRYSEIEQVTLEMESAAAAAAEWAPPLWLLEIKTDAQIVKEDVLPFLKRLNSSSSHSFCVCATPGFLNLYTPAIVAARLQQRNKTCDFCGVEAHGLLMCSGCRCAWFCDTKCQKQGWSKHKKACKEAQKYNRPRINMSKAGGLFTKGFIDTMLPESSDVDRPWLKKLTSFSEAQCSDGQLMILNSFSKLNKVMKLPAVTKYLSTQTSTTPDVDLKDPTLLQALFFTVEIFATGGSVECIPHYLPKKDANGLRCFLYDVGLDLLALQPGPQMVTIPNPEDAVFLMLASIVVMQNLTYEGLCHQHNDDKLLQKAVGNHASMVCSNLKLLRSTKPSLLRKCDKYLKEKLGATMPVETFLVCMESSALSLLTGKIADELPDISLKGLKLMVGQVKFRVEALLETPSPVANLLEDVLPFLKRLNPSPSHSVDVCAMPRFLGLYSPAIVAARLEKRNKTCDFCGVEAHGLLMCSGCRCAWFCDTKCQKQGWSKHKKACKEARKYNRRLSSHRLLYPSVAIWRMDTAAEHQLLGAQRRKTVSRRKNKAEMHANATNMSYVLITAITTAAVGWALMFWEKRKNRGLRRKLIELEASFPKSRPYDVPVTTAIEKTAAADLNHPEETDELSLQLAALRQEMEAEEHVRLLNAEDLHLQALKEELEELRKGMQEDFAAAEAASSSLHTSGRSTPNTLHTPARSVCNGADDTESLYSESRSPLLQTPSPPNHYTNSQQGYHHNHPQQRRLQALETHALSTSTSGTTTPLTPHSPFSTTQLSVDSTDTAWLAFSPSPSIENCQVAVVPPLPSGNVSVPFAGLDAALTAAFEQGSLDLDDWENEEEWLVKTARNNKSNKDQQEEDTADADTAATAPLIVRPLPKVQVPRLNLTNEYTGAGTPRGSGNGAPLTLSARGGIKNNTSSSTGTARRQLTSRLSNSSTTTGASTSVNMGTPRTARTSNTTSPSGSMTARRNKATTAAVSPSLSATAATARSKPSSGTSPLLFSKSMSAGAAARRDAPTPRLVFGATNSSATTPNSKKPAAEVKAHPLFRSPSTTSVSSVTTEGAGEGSSVDARPPTKIPRLQLPLN